jgi:hypothetical protein
VVDKFNTKIAVSDVDKLEQLLDQVPAHRDTAISKRQAIGRLTPKLRAMLAKGYSWGAIATWLSEHGLAVSRSVLQGYLRPSSSAAPGTSARARGGRQRRVEEPSAGISASTTPAHPLVVATPPVKREVPAAKPTAKEAVGRPIEHPARRSEFAVRPDSEEL